MTEKLTVTSERVDDTPLLMAQQERMGIPRLLNESFEIHGNWQGLSFGAVVASWLSHILTEADHRMSHVQPWAKRRLETLGVCTGEEVRALDFTDDRLSIVLQTLSDDRQWDTFEDAPYLYPTVVTPVSNLRALSELLEHGYAGDALADTEALYDRN